jgi:hypothetical protein
MVVSMGKLKNLGKNFCSGATVSSTYHVKIPRFEPKALQCEASI